MKRGKALRRSRFIQPAADRAHNVPERFQDCPMCDPTRTTRNNPYWRLAAEG